MRKQSKTLETDNAGFFASIGPKTRILMLALGMMLVMSLGLIIYAKSLGGACMDADNTTKVNVEIKEGSTTDSIGDLLAEKGIVEDATVFKFFTVYKKYDGQYQAGVYALSPSMTNDEIANVLREGKTNNVTFTIPEGFTEYEVAERLAKNGIVDEQKFINSLEDTSLRSEYSFLKDVQKNKHFLEGYLFPDTYSIAAGSGNDAIIRAMLDRFNEVIGEDHNARAKDMGYSLNDIIIVASIIEKEAAVDKDRRKVASVIYNRLKIDMPLQMDSSVQYVRSFDKERKKDLTYEDIEVDSEYNTYKNPGLPPGPICSPGEASIEAALNPAKTKYLYFILSDKLDDSMAFSKDYDQFLKDKDAYYAARDKAESN